MFKLVLIIMSNNAVFPQVPSETPGMNTNPNAPLMAAPQPAYPQPGYPQPTYPQPVYNPQAQPFVYILG